MGTPVELLVQSSDYIDGLLRELELMRLHTGEAPPPAFEAADELLTRYLGARLGSRAQAEAAVAAGQSLVDIELELPAVPGEAGAAGHEFLWLLDELAPQVAEGRFLMLPAAPEVHDFMHRWVKLVIDVIDSGRPWIDYSGIDDPAVADTGMPRPGVVAVQPPVGPPPPLPTARSHCVGMLPPDLQAAHGVGNQLSEVLTAWDCAALIDDVLLPANELVANAVLHARTAFEVDLLLGSETCRVAVRDGSPGMPVRHVTLPSSMPTDDVSGDAPVDAFLATTGRGLRIVEAATDRWGVEPHPESGKTVWFDLDLGSRTGAFR